MPAAQDYGNSIASSAIDQGKSAINSFDPSAKASYQQGNTNTLFNTQNKQTQDYIGKYSAAVAANPKVTDLYNQGNELFNVPGLAKTANYLQNQVTNAIPDAYTGARGYDIGSTAINNGVASKLAYLNPQSNAATNNLNTAQGLAGQYVQAGQAQNAQNLLPVQAEQANLLQEQASQATGWNQAAKSEFDGLVAKMQSGVELSKAELDRANVLAAQQTSYENAITSANATVNAAKIGAQYQKVDKGQNLIDTLGKTIINPSITNSRGIQTYG